MKIRMNSYFYLFENFRKYNKYINTRIFRQLTTSSLDPKDELFKGVAAAYSPENVEHKKYQAWEIDGRFKYDSNSFNDRDSIKYSLVLPPPNVTGSLHLGHALTTTLQDVICRWHRMKGIKVCWLPGTDHAGIATQAVVEKHLSIKGITRHTLGRNNFEKEVWKWKEKNGGRIQKQLRRLGASLDWSREVFTMDEKQSKAVNKAFIELFKRGLIYRGNHLVNWSCELRSTISDIEVDNINITGPTKLKIPGYSRAIKFGYLTEFAYKLEDESQNEIVVATTRPETILGDVAIAVNPTDKRYLHLIGQNVIHPFSKELLPIIADSAVDKEFGTGALKITPAHDKNDYEIAIRNGLPLKNVINDTGSMEENCQQFAGLKRYDARDSILNELDNRGLLRGVKPHAMSLPICSRSGDIIELLLRPQWYVDCKKMAVDALKVIENGDLVIIPEFFEKVWNAWHAEERDWCISRQLWWGHKVPVYKCYRKEFPDKFIWIAAENTTEATLEAASSLKLSSENLVCEQDPDVLDTWFSSGLYPFSSWGWPEKTDDLQRLYPLNIMVTGHDILCFWVSRMVMLSTALTGVLPFPKILLHGVICDANGAKMSKSKGNVIDPEDVINGITLEELNDKAKRFYEDGSLSEEELIKALEGYRLQFPNGIPQCGADALRFTLCCRNITSHTIQFDVDECHSNKLFCNKIWQSIKYVKNLTEVSGKNGKILCNGENLGIIDLWILSRLFSLVKKVNDSLDTYSFHSATNALKQFLYEEICDIYIECTKMTLKAHNDGEESYRRLQNHSHTFSVCFHTALRCLAPFMPYITEELIPTIPVEENSIFSFKDSIDNLSFPEVKSYESWYNERIENDMNCVMNIISTVRQLRQIYNIPNKQKPKIYIQCKKNNIHDSLIQNKTLINFLVKGTEVIVFKGDSINVDMKICSFTVDNKCKVYLDSSDLSGGKDHFLVGKEKLMKKKEKLLKNLEKLEAVVCTASYKKNASIDVQESHREKIKSLKEDLAKLE